MVNRSILHRSTFRLTSIRRRQTHIMLHFAYCTHILHNRNHFASVTICFFGGGRHNPCNFIDFVAAWGFAKISGQLVLGDAACGAHAKLVPSIFTLFTARALTDGTHAQRASALIEHNCLLGKFSSSMDSMVAEKALARAFTSLVINFMS